MKGLTLYVKHDASVAQNVRIRGISFLQKGEFKPLVSIQGISLQFYTPKPHVYIK